MRIFVLVLSLIGALTMIEHALIPSRLAVVAGRELETLEQTGSIAMFGLWAIAAGLVYSYPAVSVWIFAVAGAVGLYTGLVTDYRVLVVWGVLANGMALLTTFARREKWRSDRRERDREQWLLALSLAIPRLDASVTGVSPAGVQQESVELVSIASTSGANGKPGRPI